MNRAGAAAVAIALTAGLSRAPAAEPFDPVIFFTGSTQGKGVLKELFGKEKRTSTESFGTAMEDGWLVLDQKVLVEGSPTRQQRWKLRQTGQGKFSGTMSGADGPVDIQIVGGAIRIRYRMKNGVRVDQLLTPLASGQVIDNRSTFHKWGMKVATLTERIEKR